jgi:hypothetical protein
MSRQSDFYGSVYSTAKELGATDTQAHLAASQASLETGYGQHVVGNNYFGVKASPSYTGPTVTANTSEGEDAVSNRMDQTFRAYDGLKASVANYMDVMSNAFPDAWNATTIADAAKGLVSGKFGRYAKDINYPGKIQSIANKLGAQQKYAYAQNPENVPVPFSPEESPYASSVQAQATDGLSGLLNPVSAEDVETSSLAPIGAVPVVAVPQGFEQPDPLAPPTGLLGTAPAQSGFSDMAAAGPMGLLSTPNISQTDISRALSNVTARNEFDPGFTAGLMGPNNPVVPTSVETTSYAQPSAMASADLGSFPDAMAAQRMPATGIYSPEHLAVQAQAEKQLAASRAVPSGLLSSYTAPTSVTPAEQAIQSATAPGMSPQQIAGYQQAADSMAQAGMLNIGQQPPTDLSGNLPTNFNVLSSPALETVSVPDQPTIAGPASTEIAPAQEQQQTQQVQQAVTAKAPQSVSLGDKLRAAVNPGTAIGGLLGGVTMGPIGGLLGGLLGNSINNGSFSGLLGGQAPTANFVGTGPQAAYGIYSGGMSPGSYATASDGSTVSAQAGGDVARTNTFGTTDVANSYGGYAHDLSGWY